MARPQVADSEGHFRILRLAANGEQPKRVVHQLEVWAWGLIIVYRKRPQNWTETL
jgi:hypothetical protein